MYLAEDYGRAAFLAVARGVPPFVVGALVYHLRVPQTADRLCAFALSLTLAIAVSFGMRFIWNLVAFWVLDYRGIQVIASMCASLFTGLILPLAFYPRWAEHAMTALPWASMFQIPVDVFLGRHTGSGLAGVLVLQTAWAVSLLALGRVTLGAAARRVVVQGG
jgi:ABC-2 type transport system permease protein